MAKAAAATTTTPKPAAAKKTAAAPAAPAPLGPKLTMGDFTAGDTKKALTTLEATKGVVHMVAPGKLKVMPGFNIRVRENKDYKTAMDELKSSIKSEGFYPSKPITGFVGKEGEEDVIFVTDGHRRLEAALEVIAEGGEITSIPVVLKDPKTSVRDLTVALIKENSGAPLSMLEKSIVVKRLLNDKMSLEDIGTTFGLTKRMAQDYVVLISAPKTVRAAVSSLAITGTEAVRLLRKHVEKIDDAGKRDYSKAEKVILDLVTKAKAEGKDKVTRKDSGDETAAQKRAKGEGDTEENEPTASALVETFTHDWKIDAGATFSLKDIKAFKGLFPNSDWYEASTEDAGVAIALHDVSFKATIKMPKKPEIISEGEAESPTEESGETTEAEAEAEAADTGDL